MHIAEGYLPVSHCIGWAVASTPSITFSVRRISKIMREHPEQKLMLAASGAFLFALTALKMPSVTGSSSHPTGTGLGVRLLGPAVMPGLSLIVLVFQAVLLAHGGLSTLGANVFSLGIAGPAVVWLVGRGLERLGVRWDISWGLATALGDLATYLVTSLQLALAFPAATTGVAGAFLKFAGVFFVTQVPISLGEALLTVLVLKNLRPFLQPNADAARGNA